MRLEDHARQVNNFDNSLVKLKDSIVADIDDIGELRSRSLKMGGAHRIGYLLEKLTPFFESVGYGYKIPELKDRLEKACRETE
jgi:hypothetical protein